MSTTLSNEVWRLKNVQTECTQFLPSEGMAVPLLSFWLWLLTGQLVCLALSRFFSSCLFFFFFFFFPLLIVIKVDITLLLRFRLHDGCFACKCARTTDRVCNHFLTAVDNVRSVVLKRYTNLCKYRKLSTFASPCRVTAYVNCAPSVHETE